MEKLINLTSLTINLQENELNSLKHLAGISKLKKLRYLKLTLSNNDIRSLKHIEDLSTLEELNFLALDLSHNIKVTNKEPSWLRINVNDEEEKVSE